MCDKITDLPPCELIEYTHCRFTLLIIKLSGPPLFSRMWKEIDAGDIYFLLSFFFNDTMC